MSTTRSAALLCSAELPKGHFTHVIVDEAAQLMEAEALLPISLAGPNTTVVMAGDPQQLGPVTFSKVRSDPLLTSPLPRPVPHPQPPPAARCCLLPPPSPAKVESVHGLHCSIMERLLGIPAYTDASSAARASCHLTRNYRSHPELATLLV